MRIRSRLVLLVLAVLIPASIGSAIGSAYLYFEEQEFNRTSLSETARAMALVLDRDMQQREIILRTLAAAPSLTRNDLQSFDAYASSVAAEHGVVIILSDPHGPQLVNTRLPFGSALPQVQPEAGRRPGSEQVVIGNLRVPPADRGPPSFAIEIPVRRQGTLEYFLTMESFASQLQTILAAQRLPQGWHASIVDREGRVVARSSEPQKYVGQPVRAELWAAIQQRKEGFHPGRSLSGVASTAFFSRAPHSQWTFLVSVPDDMLYGPSLRAAALMASLALLLLGLAVATAWRWQDASHSRWKRCAKRHSGWPATSRFSPSHPAPWRSMP